MAREPRRALDVATRALARRDFSASGLRERLQRAGIDPAEAEEALGALQRAGLVDDARFALARAQMLAERGKGNAAIRFDLEQQGVAAERERADFVIARRGAGAATARLLARRGFDEDAVAAAVAREA